MVDVGAEVPVAGVVEGVDAALCVDGEECLGVGLGAEGADLGVEGAAEVAEGAGEVQAVEGVDVEGVGAIWRPGPVGRMWSPPNSAQASTAAGKTAWRCPAGEVWSRRVSAQISACLMSQRPGCQPAARSAASTGTANLVVEVRSVCICPSFV